MHIPGFRALIIFVFRFVVQSDEMAERVTEKEQPKKFYVEYPFASLLPWPRLIFFTIVNYLLGDYLIRRLMVCSSFPDVQQPARSLLPQRQPSWLLFLLESLRNYFSQFGPIKQAVVMKDTEKNVSRGFGFCIFKNPDDAVTAMDVKEHIIDDRKVFLSSAPPFEFFRLMCAGPSPRKWLHLQLSVCDPFLSAIHTPL